MKIVYNIGKLSIKRRKCMNNNEIELLIKEKEVQISKLYEQIAELKQQIKKEEQNIKSQLSLKQRSEYK